MCSKGDFKSKRNGKSPPKMAPPQVTQLGEPWKASPPWNEQTLNKLKDEVRHMVPPTSSNVRDLNVLMLGPVGAGKSGFFNTVSSTFQGHLSGQAASGSSDRSVTSRFRPYIVRDGISNKELNFKLCDTRGLEENLVDTDEFQLILEGNIKDGYLHGSAVTRPSPWIRMYTYLKDLILQYIDKKPPSNPPGYQEKTSLADKIHCVGFVFDGSTFNTMTKPFQQKIIDLQEICRQKGVPYVIMLTKMDMVCVEVSKHVSSVFHSDLVNKVVDEAAMIFSVPENCVLPVKNYKNEADVLPEVSILALLALKFMLGRAKDFLMNKCDYKQLDRQASESFIVNMPS